MERHTEHRALGSATGAEWLWQCTMDEGAMVGWLGQGVHSKVAMAMWPYPIVLDPPETVIVSKCSLKTALRLLM